MKRPVVAIATNLDDRDARVRRAYADAVRRAGGTPILIAPADADPTELVRDQLDLADALVLTGGDDPATEAYGEPTHPSAKLVHPLRQAYDEALLAEARERPDLPVLGVCLGMQMMALCAGGSLIQHMPDEVPTHAEHIDDRPHAVLAQSERSALWDGAHKPGESLGIVTSWHRQAVRSPGRLRTVGVAKDGVIEAIDDPSRPFWLGVQWHPERTEDELLGIGVFSRLLATIRR